MGKIKSGRTNKKCERDRKYYKRQNKTELT